MGFRPGELQEEVTAGTKVFGSQDTDFTRRVFFLQCLVSFSEIAQKGLGSFPSNEHDLYYKAILLSAEPARIPLKSTAKSLQLLLDDITDRKSQPADSESDISEPHILLGDTDGPPTPKPKSRKRRLNAAKNSAKKTRRGGHASSSSHASSVSGSDSDPTASSVSACDAPANVSAAAGSLRIRTLFIEGQAVLIERRLDRGDSRNYFRCIVNCPNPLHRENDRNECARRRNFDTSNDRDSIKGCLGFLGVWLRAGNQIRSRGEHKRFVPSASEVSEYIAFGNVTDHHIDTVLFS